MYNVSSKQAEEFIDHQEILDTLDYAHTNKDNRALIESLLEKAASCKGLSHREAALLLECDQPDLTERIFHLAREIKQKLYGNRIVMFAPLYLSNYCVNGCVYCPYHAKNRTIARKKLSQEEIRREVVALQDMGHKRLALEAGEDPLRNPIDYILESIQTIYGIHHKNGAIRRVNVNIAATTVENYRRLRDAGIGTYILFQETYHKGNYETLHPTGPKSKYSYHTEAMDRAMEGGINDVGIGVLFGLNTYRYDFVGLLMHAEHLEAAFGVGPHTISVPRICPADDIETKDFPNAISDEMFCRLVAVIRIAVPYTGLEKKHFKNAKETIDQVIAFNDKRRSTQSILDNNLSEVNSISKSIGQLMKEGKKEEAETAKSRVAELKEVNKTLQTEMDQAAEDMQNLLYTIPNVPYNEVPEGVGAEDNVVEKMGGMETELPKDALPHWELTKKYDLIDFDLGVKITGAGFPVYKGKGAQLQRALINFFLDEARKAGYLEIMPPTVVNTASGYGTGQLPDKEGQMYHCEVDDLYLIPTAEVPVTNIYRDVILEEKQLPIKNCAYTQCFRREAGSYGKDVRGLNRLHEFSKVELVRIDKPEHSRQSHKEMLDHVEGLLQKLELPYRILRLCGGDMSFTAALCFDFEVYSEAQKRWLEVSSVSNFDTYQANRLKCRYRSGEKKTELCHTLNGSALALPRIVAALLENNQTPEGIRIPKALVPYTGFEMID